MPRPFTGSPSPQPRRGGCSWLPAPCGEGRCHTAGCEAWAAHGARAAALVPGPSHTRCLSQPGTYARCSTLRSSRAGRPGCHQPRRRSGRSGHHGACRGASSCPRSSSRCRPPGRSSAAGSAGPSARPATSPRPPPATAGSPSG